MKQLLLLLLLLTPAYADEASYLKLGAGMDDGFGSYKLAAIGYQDALFGPFDYQLEGGVFGTDRGYTVFASPSFGLAAMSDGGVYAKIFTGPALLSGVDNRLSSILELNSDLEVGVKGSNGVSLGLVYKHMSNAGLWQPNPGRNWLMLKFAIPL